MSNSFKIGRIPFLVCCPFFHRHIGESGYEFVDGSPAECNQGLASGEIQAAPSSSIEYARHYKDYYISPEFCTSSQQSIGSVILFSQVPWEEIEEVQLTAQSETSICLLDILFKEWRGKEAKLTPLDSTHDQPKLAMDQPQSILLIGDQALRERTANSDSNQWAYQYDLASLWREWHDLPFVFGLWIFRRSHPEEAKKWHQEISQSLQEFQTHPEKIISQWIEQYPCDLAETEWQEYFDNINYRLQQDSLKSLKLFYKYAEELGHIDEVPRLKFLDIGLEEEYQHILEDYANR